MKWRNVLIVFAITIPVAVVLALGFSFDPHAVPSVLPGKPAPQCDLRTLDGQGVSLTDFHGKPVLVNFWSTWCVPCEMEHRLLQQAAQTYGDRAQFLGVVYQDEESAVRRYVARKGASYPQMMDPGSRCSIDYGVAGVPESFFIDKNGVVAFKKTGPLTGQELRANLDPLLGDRS
jgi:cytochrome c biogenesis protein CcmG/thiol:disulfide interchange protein DsbE